LEISLQTKTACSRAIEAALLREASRFRQKIAQFTWER